MAEYIEREALKEHIKSYAGMFTDEIGFAVSLEAVLRGIDFQPAADVAEVKHGRWSCDSEDGFDNYDWHCDRCGGSVGYRCGNPVFTKFCPNCGARTGDS